MQDKIKTYLKKVSLKDEILSKISKNLYEKSMFSLNASLDSQTRLVKMQHLLTTRPNDSYEDKQSKQSFINQFKTTSNGFSSNSSLTQRKPRYLSKYSDEEDNHECTFHPKINRSKKTLLSQNSNSSSVYERLYTDFAKMSLIKDIRAKEDAKSKGEESYFCPKTYKTPKKYVSNLSFNERLQNYKKKYEEGKKKIKEGRDIDLNENCTFQPKMEARNASHRILSKSLEKLNAKPEIVPAEEKDSFINSQMQLRSKRKVDKDRIEALYKNYQQRKKKIADIKTKMDQDSGVTFRPEIYTKNNKYNKDLDNKYKGAPISQRSQKFLEDKSEHLIKITEEQFSYQKPKRIYTDREKEQITQNIIQRLYALGVRKQLTRNACSPDSIVGSHSEEIQQVQSLQSNVTVPKNEEITK